MSNAQLEATIPFLPECYPLLFFYVHCTLEIHSAGEKLHSVLDDLENVFPGPTLSPSSDDQDEDYDKGGFGDESGAGRASGCSIIRGLRALVHYHVRGATPVSHVDSLISRRHLAHLR